jgi:hypothetical protein
MSKREYDFQRIHKEVKNHGIVLPDTFTAVAGLEDSVFAVPSESDSALWCCGNQFESFLAWINLADGSGIVDVSKYVQRPYLPIESNDEILDFSGKPIYLIGNSQPPSERGLSMAEEREKDHYLPREGRLVPFTCDGGISFIVQKSKQVLKAREVVMIDPKNGRYEELWRR